MNKYYFRLLLVIIGAIFVSTGCPSNPSHSNASNGIILQGFQKPGDFVGNLVMASGDRLYLAWIGTSTNTFTTTAPINVYVSVWDGHNLNQLGNVVGEVNTSGASSLMDSTLISLGMYNGSPVIAVAGITGVTLDEWTGGSWNVIGNLPLADISDTVTAISSITATSNKLYLAYGEQLTTGSTVLNVYTYDGTNWQSLPSPAAISSTSSIASPDMAIMNNNPVAVWMDVNNGTGDLAIPVSEWSGTQWTSLSGNMKVYDSPWFMSMGLPSCSITGIPNGIAVMWNEGKPVTDPSMGLIYMPTGIVSAYNGTQWTRLDDEVNSDYPGIATDARDAEQLHGLWMNGKLYVTFTEMGQVFLAYYNGSGFSYIGNTLNAHPWLSGGYVASSPYLAQWNGKLYLSFVEYSMDQNTGLITSNPVVRRITP